MNNRLSIKLVPLVMALTITGGVLVTSTTSIVSATSTDSNNVSTHGVMGGSTAPIKTNTSLADGVVAYAEATGGVTFSVAQSTEAQSRSELMLRVSPSLKFNKQGLMEATLSDVNLATKYSLDKTQIGIVHLAISNYNHGYVDATNPIQYKAKLKGGNLYLSYSEIVGIISVVNDVGPLALAAAISGVTSVIPGVGTIIGGAVALLGSGTIILTMTRAIVKKKGIRIGLDGIAAVKY